MSRYLVNPKWPFPYRKHKPGEEFVANLERDVEERAVEKGALVVLDDSPERVQPSSATPPKKP